MEKNLIETIKLITDISEDIIKIIESDDYSKLDQALSDRQKAIDFLTSLGYTKEEYKEVEKQFQINDLHNRLIKVIGDKKIELKGKLQLLSRNKEVAKCYNHNNLSSAKIFSKKI